MVSLSGGSVPPIQRTYFDRTLLSIRSKLPHRLLLFDKMLSTSISPNLRFRISEDQKSEAQDQGEREQRNPKA